MARQSWRVRALSGGAERKRRRKGRRANLRTNGVQVAFCRLVPGRTPTWLHETDLGRPVSWGNEMDGNRPRAPWRIEVIAEV